MARLTLELETLPDGVSVSSLREGERYTPAASEFFIGREPSSELAVHVEPGHWEAFCRAGWGGRRNCRITIEGERWVVHHLGHGGVIRVNGQPMPTHGRRELVHGDQLEPSLGFVFRVLDEAVATLREPPELLDAIAEAPRDLARWHVLADWLIEHQAPHALMAAYELKLEHGTNDPDLLGDYAAIRRRRHVLGDLRHDHVTWCCGYVVSCSVWLGPRDQHEVERLSRAFGAPQFAALSRLTLQCSGTESAARLEGVLSALPRTVRTVGLSFNAPAPIASLFALKARPPRAHTVQLRLAEPVGPLAPLVDVLVASGWATLDLEATRLTERAGELQTLAARHPDTRFVLGGTSLTGRAALGLRAPNVAWTTADHDALLVDLDGGAVFPLARARQGFTWGLPLRPLGAGWNVPGHDGLLASGETVRGLGRRFVFLTGPALDEQYRAWLEAHTAELAGVDR
ncbi:MAG: hypothetical protein JNJ54_02715 [Myxococcaceae bacterium]|nr:hypothetical protein [Myxococcaceae bacterium]